jgi:hypothetical protein
VSEYLDRIMRILGPAASQPAPDWDAVNDYLGLALPRSFVQFVETYSFGTLGFLIFSHPSPTADGFRDLLTQIKQGREYLEDRRRTWRWEEHRGVPYPIHPEPGGLIRWGTSIDAESFYFLAQPASDPVRWPVVWHDAASADHTWNEFPGPFDRFLYELMTRRLPLPEQLAGDHEEFDVFKSTGNGFPKSP